MNGMNRSVPGRGQHHLRRGFRLVTTLFLMGSLLAVDFLAGCASAPPPPPIPVAVQQAQRQADTAARLWQARNWPAAAREWLQAAESFAILNDLPNEAMARHNLAQAQRELGESQSAGASFERAAELNWECRRTNEWWRNQIGLLQLETQTGQMEALERRLDRLTAQQPSLEPAELRGLFFNELGLWHQRRGELSQAATAYQQAEAAFAQAKNQEGQAAVSANRARLKVVQGDFSFALTEWRQALDRYQRLGDPRGIALAIAGQGQALLAAKQDMPAAETLLRRAAQSYRILKLKRELAVVLQSLHECLLAQHKTSEADRVEAELKQLPPQ